MIRRYIAECIGAFAIVFFGCGAIATLQDMAGANLAINLAFGLTVATGVFVLGHISAAHMNPAVTIGFAVARRFPWKYVPAYIGAQCLGAIAASAMHALLMPEAARAVNFGSNTPAVDALRCIGIEAILTGFLMLTVMSVATDKRVSQPIPGMAIGAVITLCGLFGGTLTGASLNPARSLGPALFAGTGGLSVLWLYIVGPVIGGICGALLYEGVRGDSRHAKNAPNDLEQALEQIEAST